MDKQKLPTFTQEAGLAFLAYRYGLVVTEGQGPTARLDQDRLRAIKILVDFQAHLPISVRRRRASPYFIGPWRPIMEAFVDFEKHAGRSARTMDSHVL